MPEDLLDSYGGYRAVNTVASGLFRVEKIKGRWWFITPEGNAFISMGINHIESTFLKYPDNIHIWKKRYGSDERWIKEGVVPDLKKWNFNTIGWTQEVAAKGMLHSPGWRYPEYQWAGLPYVHMLKFADIAMWDPNPQFPNVFSEEFEEKCDFVARDSCVEMEDDPKLIGYFYSDMTTWQKHRQVKSWTADYDLDTESGRAEVKRIAEKYYQVIHDAVRRYDKNHLLLGDRHDGDGGVPDCVLEASAPTVDVMSVQYYTSYDVMEADLARWNKLLDKPIFLADSAFLAPTRLLKIKEGGKVYCPDQKTRGERYADMATQAYSTPYVIGWHWCAYAENLARKSGVKNHFDEPYEDLVSRMQEFNARVYNVATQACSAE
ncbi:hypothetical protein ACFL1X_00955 [Candidatus Hydrogenedentota bacterium]